MSVQEIQYAGSGGTGTFVFDPTTGFTGVGTAAPNNAFQVHLATDRNIAFSYANGVPEIIGINDANNAWEPLYIDAVDLLLNTQSSGKVGIGTISPAHTLDVTGTLGVSGNASLGGMLAVTGAATLSSTLAVTGNTTVGGDLTSTGTITANAPLISIAAAGQITATLGITSADSLNVGAVFNVDSSGNITGHSLGVAQGVTAASLSVTGAAATTGQVLSTSVNTGSLGVSGATGIGGNLAVTGNVTVGGGGGMSINAGAGSITCNDISAADISASSLSAGSVGTSGNITSSSEMICGTSIAGAFAIGVGGGSPTYGDSGSITFGGSHSLTVINGIVTHIS